LEKRTILLVEDNPDDERLTLRSLNRGKVVNRVVVARDGVQALEMLFGSDADSATGPPELPELVLLDLKLPKVDGLEVLRRIRSETRTRILPVVILTSSDEERDLVESYRLGANSYVRKPVDFTKFMEAVAQLELYWMVINQLPPAGRGSE
jgi:two-component system, response regulator